MDKSSISPEESFQLIAKTIQETKKRFEDNGHLFIFSGLIMFVVCLSQFVLIQLELYSINWYPNFLYPLGAIYTFFYAFNKYKKKKIPSNLIGNILASLGWMLGLNLMILGFFFSNKLGEAIAPVFLIFMAFFICISGVTVKYKPLIWGGILLNLIGLATFYFEWQYHPLIMAVGSVVALIIPGILLNNKRKRADV
ncbi:MAG: hypothetical protein PHF38_03715 [Bacteroidales bacterium]|nr:hypothetical protein [Bacteroidales bacterium]